MTIATPQWLQGRRALVAGNAPGAEAIAVALARHGAAVVRAGTAATDAPEIAAAFAAAEQSADGGMDILIHAGTPMAAAAPQDIGLAAWRATHSADIDGRFLHAAEFTRRRLATAGRGAILFLMPSPVIAPGRAAPATAHGALDNLVKSLAVEWARDGIRINAIASHVAENFAGAAQAEQESLANLAAYLVSDYAAYVTGCVMGISE